MIVCGIVLLVLAWVLPDFVAVPFGVEHALTVVGWLLVVFGIVLFVISLLTGRPIGPRRWYY